MRQKENKFLFLPHPNLDHCRITKGILTCFDSASKTSVIIRITLARNFKIIPMPNINQRPMLLNNLSRFYGQLQWCILSICTRFYCQYCILGSLIHEFDINITISNVIAHSNFRFNTTIDNTLSIPLK
ncbi:hypothetical protein C6W84_4325 [Acinetobacter baumannii]|nr:hypothetical protein C6W84_4325 [Acinetobacter baumannii]